MCGRPAIVLFPKAQRSSGCHPFMTTVNQGRGQHADQPWPARKPFAQSGNDSQLLSPSPFPLLPAAHKHNALRTRPTSSPKTTATGYYIMHSVKPSIEQTLHKFAAATSTASGCSHVCALMRTARRSRLQRSYKRVHKRFGAAPKPAQQAHQTSAMVSRARMISGLASI